MTNLWATIRTVLIAIAIAAVIWLTAEGQNVRALDMSFLIRFEPAPGQELLIGPRNSVTVEATVRCATSQVSDVRAIAREQITVPVSPAADSDTVDIDLARVINNHPGLASRGVQVSEVRPRTVSLTVRRLITVDMPVLINIAGLSLAANADVTPATVAVRMPEQFQPVAEKLQAQVDMGELSVEQIEPNVAQQRDLPIRLPQELQTANVTVTPTTATVSFTLQSESYTPPKVPIDVRLPGNRLDVDVTLQTESNLPLLNNVTVTGPTDVIQRLKREEIEVRAVLWLTQEDIDNAITAKQVYLDLPTGLTPKGEIPAVELKITRRP